MAQRRGDLGFHLQQLAAFDKCAEQLLAKAVRAWRAAVQQVFGSLGAGLDAEQAQRHLIGFGDMYQPGQQLVALRRAL